MSKISFLVRHSPDGKADGKSHIWVNGDTACHLWSTGGLTRTCDWRQHDEPPTALCQLCHPERYELPKPKQATLFD